MGSKICDVGAFRGGAVIGFAARTEVIPMLGDCPDFEEAAKEGDDINPAPGRPSPAPANAVSRIEAGGLFPISSLLSNDKLPACPFVTFIFFFLGLDGSVLTLLEVIKSSAVRSLCR